MFGKRAQQGEFIGIIGRCRDDLEHPCISIARAASISALGSSASE